MRTYYADYVNHILRFYARHAGIRRYRTDADRLNYLAAERVCLRLKEVERRILKDVYSRNDTMSDNVYEVAKNYKISQDAVYALIAEVSRQIAKERKLI